MRGVTVAGVEQPDSKQLRDNVYTIPPIMRSGLFVPNLSGIRVQLTPLKLEKHVRLNEIPLMMTEEWGKK